MEQDEKYTLTLKGLIFSSLGGYTAESKGLKSFENTDKVIDGLTDYLIRNNLALAPHNGKLEFVEFKEPKLKRKWFRLY